MLVSLALGGLLSVAFAAPSSSSRSFAHFETHRAPRTFERIGDAPGHHTLTLRIGLRQPRISELQELAYAVADPTNPQYGAHLSDEEIEALSAPHSDSVDAVAEWLASHGLNGEHSKTSEWIVVPNVQISKVEKMLDAKYGIYRHEDGSHLVRTESYSLPQFMHQHVDLVQVHRLSHCRPRPG